MGFEFERKFLWGRWWKREKVMLERECVEGVWFGNREEGRMVLMSFQWNHGGEDFKVGFGSIGKKHEKVL